MHGTAKQTARWIALSALFLVPLAPLVVTGGFFFPFITGKAFYLRALIEVTFCAWLVLALIDKAYRPHFSWLGLIVLTFVSWMFLADTLAPNAAKAFWSNFERMEGWVYLAHLLGFFAASSAVLRVEQKWRAWFFTSLGVSVALSFYALFQIAGVFAIHQGSHRIDATLGNSSYFAVYLIFSAFVALWLAFSERREWLKWSLIVLAAIQSILVFFTGTRGAILGLIGAFFLAALFTAFTEGKRVRGIAVGAIALMILAVSGVYMVRDSSFVQESDTLRRLTSISLVDGQVRFTIWGMAWEGVKERPLVGWGQEGFNYVFNKHYVPSLYNQEQWFDRAHNAFVDWLSAGGIPAFLLYIALFISAVFLLWTRPEFSRSERIWLTAALAGYATHNFFVFDNLYSYIYFFAILAFIDSRAGRPIAKLEQAEVLDDAAATTYALPFALVLGVALLWYVNVPGMTVATKLIDALTNRPDGIAENVRIFEELAADPAFAKQEVREQLVSYAASVAPSNAKTEDKQRIVALAISEMEKHVASYPDDARARLQLAFAYRVGGMSEEAFREVQEALRLSPQKVGIWLQLGTVEWERGNPEDALKTFLKAYEMAPQYSELATYAAAGYFAVGDARSGEALLQKAFGTIDVDNEVLATAYYRMKDWPRLIRLWKLRTEKPDASLQTWFSYAAAYYAAGDSATAIRILNEVAAAYPQAAESVKQAISQIQSGQ